MTSPLTQKDIESKECIIASFAGKNELNKDQFIYDLAIDNHQLESKNDKYVRVSRVREAIKLLKNKMGTVEEANPCMKCGSIQCAVCSDDYLKFIDSCFQIQEEDK